MFHALRRIHVAASDFSRSRRFYGETMGLSELGSFENDWVEFGLGPIVLKLTPLRSGEVPARNQVAAIFSTDALDATLQTLKERGVTVTRPPQEEFTGRSAEILDPDGYRIIAFQPSDLHPDEEWVPMSKVDEVVRHKLAARRQKEKAKSAPKKGAPSPKKATPRSRAAVRKPAKRTPKRTAKKTAKKVSKTARKPVRKAAKKPARDASKKARKSTPKKR